MDLNELQITDITALLYVIKTSGEHDEIQHRKTYGATFAVDGELEYTLNGKTVVSHTGNLLILPKGKKYFIHCTKSGHFPVINFDIAPHQSIPDFLAFPIVDGTALLDIFRNLETLQRSTATKNRLKKLALIYDLLSYALIPLSEREASAKRTVLKPAIQHLEENFDNPNLNNTKLAQKSFLSEIHFRNLFKEEFGITPKQYLQQLRIEKAKELLESHFFSVTAVASMVGYANIYHFSKAFKATTGYTPSEYKDKPH